MRRIVTISFTGLNAKGGVPQFNRDIHWSFPYREVAHFCWEDFPWHIEMEGLPEWEKARTLNHYLVQQRLVTADDVVIADGFWADGLQHLPFAISHSHGIWSHLTKDDVDAGKPPDMPYHHAAQVAFRQRWTKLGKRITAVSEFIAEQMKRQWGFEVDAVINNGVDTAHFRPIEQNRYYEALPPHPLIIHGVNDRGNTNKGWDHIELLKLRCETDAELRGVSVMSLDEVWELMRIRSDRVFTKAEALGQADLVVHPSGYEGNSMFVAEALACGIPVIGYDVGFLWSIRDRGTWPGPMDRNRRSPEFTLQAVKSALTLASGGERKRQGQISRLLAEEFLSIEAFRRSWHEYVAWVEGPFPQRPELPA